MRLGDKVAIVSGAARGIGKAIALALAKEGALLTLADIDEEMHNVAREVEALGSKILTVRCDVSKWDDVQAVVSRTIDTHGRIDILVNNAGVAQDALIEKISPEDFDWLVKINAKGPFMFCKAVVPQMKMQRQGRIVNISSAAGLIGLAGSTSYSMSKFAVVGLTQALAKEVGGYNINVNAVCPGIVLTDMWKYAAKQSDFVEFWFPGRKPSDPTPERIVDEIAARNMALQRPQTPEDIANTVVFLCSEDSKNITGQSISVDGGYVYH